MTAAARWFLIGLVGMAGLACLYWSGSKGGWLLMLMLGLMVLLRLRFNQRLKIALVTGVLLAGLAGFFLRHAGVLPERGHQCKRPVRLLAGCGPNGQRQAALRHGAGDVCHRLSEDQTA